MRILAIDIETSPNIAHVWGLFNQNIGLNQVMDTTRVICFVAKWYGDPVERAVFRSEFHDGRDEMVREAHRLLDEADVLMHYNGDRFDVPHLNREFVRLGLTPPAPYKSIDLLKVVKRRFRFTSNKLAHVSEYLGLRGKEETGGHGLWVRCMAGDADAWETMRAYNLRDVTLLDEVYDKLQPWITNHPHHGLYSGEDHVCPNCGSGDLEKRGFAYTAVSKFQRYRCKPCGTWSKGNKRIDGMATTQVKG